MPIVTLTTDFGHADIYAGRFKGQLISTVEQLNVIDITHGIPAFNIITGGYSVRYTYDSYPKGTFHIIRVNEQGIANEGMLIAAFNGHFFMAPDNGILPLALNNQFDWVRSVNFDEIDSSNSDEIYSLVLKSLIDNTHENISVAKQDYIAKTEWAITKSEKMIRGMVVIVDNFGNLTTNIHFSELAGYFKRFESFTVHYRDKEVLDKIVGNYNEVAEGEKMCRVNDLGFLEIAINKGAASKLLGIKFGHIVYVRFYDSQDS